MSVSKIAAAAVTLVALAGCAAKPGGPVAASAGPRDCFNASSITNYAAQDRETVNLKVGANQYFQVKLLGVCPDIDWSQKIGFQTAGSALVCTGLDVTISVPSPVGPQECAGDSVRRLSAAEVAALPAKARP